MDATTATEAGYVGEDVETSSSKGAAAARMAPMPALVYQPIEPNKRQYDHLYLGHKRLYDHF